MRAGEAGKGLAVVASDVKTLAGLTAKATAAFASQIKSIQEAPGGAVKDFHGDSAPSPKSTALRIAPGTLGRERHSG
ncbi:hypothetical protein [Rhodoblastus acidophilus]|uniref:hypothetical protein n=1 Tax=Rhodoblastus acidophilus TaxID=1074 RepID=UPI002224FF08|nr:hypothetical protein [Rhodoblastus acidophilus]